MEPKQSIEELTRRNVAIIAEMEKAAAQVRTRGDRVAEWLAAWVGSWPFLVTQTIILLAWMALNISALINHWDPYPCILLNLALSFEVEIEKRVEEIADIMEGGDVDAEGGRSLASD